MLVSAVPPIMVQTEANPEGLPLARVAVPGGKVEPLTHAQYGPFRDLYLTPAQAREQYAGRTWVPVTDALTEAQVGQLRGLGPVVLVALVGTGTPDLSPVALIRATRLVAQTLPDAAVVAVPLAAHDDPDADHALGVQVLATYAGDDPVVALVDDPDGDYAEAASGVLEEEIRSSGFYRNKTKLLIGMGKALVEHFDGEPPRTIAELTTIPGVARKTANVVLGTAYGIAEGVVVDTHVRRLSQRLGLSSSDTPTKIEQDLMKVLLTA